MKFPFLLSGINIGKGKKFRENSETIFNKSLRSLTDMRFHFSRDLMKVVELVSDHSYQISNRFEIIFPVKVDL